MEIITFRIGDIRPGIFNRFNDPMGYLSHCGERWAKLASENPLASAEDPAITFALDGNDVAGRLGFYPAEVFYKKQRIRMLWMSGFFLNEKYKTSGAGGFMLLNAISLSKCLIASGGPRKDAQQLYLKAGFRELGPLKRHVLFLNSKVLAGKFIKNNFMLNMVSAIASPALSVYNMRCIGRKPKELEFVPVSSYTEDIDRMFASVDINHLPRTARTLNWIIGNVSDLWSFSIRKGGSLAGYCMLRLRHHKGGGPHNLPPMAIGSLIDYYLPDGSLTDMVTFAAGFLRDKGADVFEFQVHDPKAAQACRSLGMVHLSGNRVFFRPPKPEPEGQEEWFLTHGVSDVILD